MNDQTFLDSARGHLKENSKTEVGVREDLPELNEIWKQIQALKQEMYEAKKTAADRAAKPYLEKLKQLEAEYALALKLMA